jgi:hypothetical protein
MRAIRSDDADAAIALLLCFSHLTLPKFHLHATLRLPRSYASHLAAAALPFLPTVSAGGSDTAATEGEPSNGDEEIEIAPGPGVTAAEMAGVGGGCGGKEWNC